MPKRLSQKEFKEIYSKVPRLCVDIIIKTPDGILLTKRADFLSYSSYWHIPGGTVFFEETLEQAVKRVAKEELNLEVEIIRLLGYLEFPSEKTIGRKGGHSIGLEFLTKIISGDIKLSNEATDFGFFQEAPEKTVPEHKKLMESLTKAS